MRTRDSYRTAVVEHLQLMSSTKAQLEYAGAVPVVDVPTELVCMWEDLVPDERALERISNPPFSPAEQRAIREFHKAWSCFAASSADPIPPLDDERWSELRASAAAALSQFRTAPHNK